MKTTKSKTVVRTLIAGGAVVFGLAFSTGQMAATSTGETDRAADVLLAPRAVQPSITETVLNADSRPDVFARAGAARDALGFPQGSSRTGKHVHDGYRGLDYDEVSDVDAAGQPVALTQFDARGHLVDAVRFDPPSAIGAKVTGDAATKTAQHGLAVSGISVAGQPETDTDQVAGGWNVHWSRTQSGLPVRGDEARVHIRPDGRIQSVAQVEHSLAPAPARRLGQAEAQQAVSKQFDAWFADKGSGYTVQGLALEWVGPNAAFDETKLGAAPEPYRLAWVANVKPTGLASDYLSLITVYVDAGNGTIIGGDVVE